MRVFSSLLTVAVVGAAMACGSDNVTTCCTTGEPALRVINAFTTPVDVLIDGQMAIQSLAAGAIDTAAAPSGTHTVVLGASGSVSSSQSISTTTGVLSTIAAVRAMSGGVS